MRAIRMWGSVRGVPGDWHPYRDLRRDATRAPTQRPEMRGRRKPPSRHFWRESVKSREREGRALAVFKVLLVPQSVSAVLVRQLFGPHLRTCP